MIVRPVTVTDEPQWRPLYRAYRDFYELDADESVVTRVWQWLLDEAVELHGVVALGGSTADNVQGIAVYRCFLEPSTGMSGLYLEDLFVRPERRGEGTATILLRHLAALAEQSGQGVVRWVTAADNVRARRVYDSLATATTWITYDMPPAGGQDSAI